MLDTIVLTLSKNMYQIFEPDKFEPSARWVLDTNASLGGRGYIASKQNPTSTELKAGIYKPRLTLTNRYNHTGQREATLKIELSLPKLIFGNNFDELQDTDFDQVVSLLKQRLNGMGVFFFPHHLVNAPVSAVHYSKNIPLTDGTTPRYYIKKIQEANVPFSLDINQTDYRNEGHSFKWHCNSYEVAFYDKIRDLEMARKSDKRAIESDNTIQLNLFDTAKRRRPFEVLRVEVRLNKRQKIAQLFRILELPQDITFKNVFSTNTAKLVLSYYLEEMEKKRPKLMNYQSKNPEAFLSDLVINNPKLGIKKTMQLFGLKTALDSVNPREIRRMFSGYHQRSWYRLISEANKIRLPIKDDTFNVMHSNLTDFVPLKLVDFQQQMLNNDKYC